MRNELTVIKKDSLKKYIMKNWEFYLLLLPALIYFVVFHFIPMYGIQIAFKNYNPANGIFAGEWVGLDHFKRFLTSFNIKLLLKNTLVIQLYSLVAGFPIPIILALMLNELKNKYYKSFVQSVTYMPHFISTVVMAGMILAFLSPSTGIINKIIGLFGKGAVSFILIPDYFKHIFVWSGIWQTMGWSSIIFMAALSGVDPALYEAARVDGASRLRCIIHINLPSIMPTVIVIFILSVGRLMNLGYEKVLLLQNPMNMESSDIISTYVYRVGILDVQYSFSTAVNLFNSVINMILLFGTNFISKKAGQTGLF